MTAVTSPNTAASTTTFASMPPADPLPPMTMSSGEPSVTLSWATATSLMTRKNSRGNGASRGLALRRPRMIPVPMPRKLPIRMMFVKKPM